MEKLCFQHQRHGNKTNKWWQIVSAPMAVRSEDGYDEIMVVAVRMDDNLCSCFSVNDINKAYEYNETIAKDFADKMEKEAENED